MMTIFNLMASAASWSQGWDGILAIGTLVLAACTGGLMLAARSEVRRYMRPILVPYGKNFEIGPSPRGDARLLLALRNDGTGPALSLRITIAQPGVTYPMSTGPVPVKETCQFPLTPPPGIEEFGVLVDYEDIAGRRYSTQFTVGLECGASWGGRPSEAVRCWVIDAQYHLNRRLVTDEYYKHSVKADPAGRVTV